MDNSLQHLQFVQAQDLVPNQQTCHTTICIVAGMETPRNQNEHTANRNPDYLEQLELRAGIANWPIPSIETRSLPDSRVVNTHKGAEQVKHYDLRDRLGVLNGRHGTHLSVLELEICVSLVDYRLGTTTTTIAVLDEFLNSPLLFDAPRWRRSANANPYTAGKSKMPSSQPRDDDEKIEFNTLVPGADAADVRAVLKMINIRAGTSFLLKELEVVVSLMNHLHGKAIGLLDVLGLRNGGQHPGLSEPQVVDAELMRGLGTLNLGVGSWNGMVDLKKMSSRGRAREARRRRGGGLDFLSFSLLEEGRKW